ASARAARGVGACGSGLLPLSRARGQGAARHGLPDLAAPGLAVALARHLRLVLAEVPVEAPLPRCVPVVSIQRLPGRRAVRRADPNARLEGGIGPFMCGIAGIVKLDPAETVDEARLKRMRDVLRHRGPDG